MRIETIIGEDTATADLAKKLPVDKNPCKALQAVALARSSWLQRIVDQTQ